jgi:hypothetical protein
MVDEILKRERNKYKRKQTENKETQESMYRVKCLYLTALTGF